MKNIEDIYHLTPVQRDMLADALSAPAARVVQVGWHFGASLDADAFEQGWRQVLARHPTLRTCFLSERLEQPVQVVRQQVALPYERQDWAGVGREQQPGKTQELLLADARRGFDLARAPLFRLTQISLAGGDQQLILSHHPLLLDGRSADLLLGEALAFYRAATEGAECRLAAAAPFREYVRWVERQDLTGAELYWRGSPEGATLRTPRTTPADEAARRGEAPPSVSRQASLSPPATEELKDCARREGVSLETLVVGAWSLVLMRESGGGGVCVGVAARELPRTLPCAERLAGMAESVLPLRVSFPSEVATSAWLSEIERRRAELQRFAHVSRSQIRSWVGAGDGQSLMDSAVLFPPTPPAFEGDEAGPATGRAVRFNRALDYPLALEVTPGERLLLTLHDGSGRDGGTHAARLLESLQEALGRLTFPARRLAEAPAHSRGGHQREGEAASNGGPQAAHVTASGNASSASGSTNGRTAVEDFEPVSWQGAKPLDFSLFYFADDNAVLGEDKYRLYLEGARFADRHGLTAVWTPERHFHEKAGLYPNPSVLSAALATITEHVQLRAGSVVLPLHHSLRVAEEWSVVDNLSKGRAGVSFTSGWMPNDFAFFPERYDDKREEMFRGIREVQELWRGKAIAGLDGKGKEIELKVFPKPIREELPVWLTCSGGPEMFEKAGELGCHVLTALLTQSVEEAAPKIKLYRESLARHGHDPASGTVTMMIHTFLGEDPQAVQEKVRGPLTKYLKSHLSLIETGAQSLNLQVGLSEEEYREKYQDQLAEFAFERYYRMASLIGTPASCLKMVGRLKEIGVDEVACLIDFGVDVDSVLESLSHLTVLKELDERASAGHFKSPGRRLG